VDGDSTSGEDSGVRVDRWTWAVRLFKTRSLASAACRKSQLLVNGQRCRPSRRVRVGDQVQVTRGRLTRTVEVGALLEKRVGAKRVEEFLVDHTPAEEYQRAAEIARRSRETAPMREPGTGRPTKRERRELDELMHGESEPEPGEEDDASFEEFLRSFLKDR